MCYSIYSFKILVIKNVSRLDWNRSGWIDLKDRIYRFRYVLNKDAFPIPRPPITGFVIQPRSSETNSPAYDKTYYIFEVETYQEFERGVSDGIYYLSVLNASVAPATSNFDDFSFSQQTVDVYPTFDRDNPVADPAPAVSVASNEIIGAVTTTDGAQPNPAEDKKLSITKETTQFFLLEQEKIFVRIRSVFVIFYSE